MEMRAKRGVRSDSLDRLGTGSSLKEERWLRITIRPRKVEVRFRPGVRGTFGPGKVAEHLLDYEEQD